MNSILSTVHNPEDLKKLSREELMQLAGELRREIIDTVSMRGGHLASNLGAVELTIALHATFDSPKDKILFDVGHQSYAHKLLTGRQEAFSTLRSYGGISGFPRKAESEHDVFDTGHSSTAISCALGLARARDLRKEDHHVVAVVGDGALTGGMCYEAMNDAGNMNSRLIVILNDNEMSISRNVGALANHLTRLRASTGWSSTKTAVKRSLERIPLIGKPLAESLERFKNTTKHLLTHGELFEALGFRYLGPIDGHNIDMLREVLEEAKKVSDIPLLIHVITQKGHGYELAENKPHKYHGIAPFYAENGVKRNQSLKPSAAWIAGDCLSALAQEDESIVAITAAMTDGTGLGKFCKTYPTRFFDVGIAEEHALTMAAGMARGGLKPYFVVYSTFLQRGYDQIIHDICLQDLPVRMLIDHAGLVGEDGSTHHGVFDLSFLNTIPNLTVLESRDIHELQAMIRWSASYDHPCAIRYIKEGLDMSEEYPYEGFTLGRWEILRPAGALTILAHGRMVHHALQAADILQKGGISCGVVNASTLKPLDEALLGTLFSSGTQIAVVEETVPHGALGENIAGYCVMHGHRLPMAHLCLKDAFVAHGALNLLLEEQGLMPQQIAKVLEEKMKERS